MAGALLLPACKSGQVETKLDEGFKSLFAPRKTPQQYMLVAVSSEDPDARRDAVVQISQSKQYSHEWAIKGLVAVALLESEPQTRCVAIRALSRTGDPRATETALKILNYEDYPPQEVWPPMPVCRWDATFALARLLEHQQVPEDYQESVRQTLLKRLKLDEDRHARVCAARGLGCCADVEVVAALLEGLRDEDFAVVHECENSLVKLTGRTHVVDAVAWEHWVGENGDGLFVHRGEIPESRRPPYRNGVEKFGYDTVELMKWLWPGPKEQ